MATPTTDRLINLPHRDRNETHGNQCPSRLARASIVAYLFVVVAIHVLPAGRPSNGEHGVRTNPFYSNYVRHHEEKGSVDPFVASQEQRSSEEKELSEHTIPTLLSVLSSNRDQQTKLGPKHLNALHNKLYQEMLSPHVQFQMEMRDSSQHDSLRRHSGSLSVDKTDVSFHEPLTLSWTGDVTDDDVIALYCPATETNPRQFQDAANVYLAKLSSTYHRTNRQDSQKVVDTSRSRNEWYIHSFPIIREESCEFRLFARLTNQQSKDADSIANPWKEEEDASVAKRRVRTKSSPTNTKLIYQVVATSKPLYIKNLLKPTAVHIALSENIDEMRVHFTTGRKESRRHDANVEIVPVVRYYPNTRLALTSRLHVKIHVGTTTSYKASDMCSEPANITSPGKFRDPGLLHVVTLDGLQPDAEYVYQPGVLVLQDHDDSQQTATHWQTAVGRREINMQDKASIIWSDETFTFTSSPLTGSKDSQPFAFLVYGDQGCPETGWTLGAETVAKRMERELSNPRKVKVRAIHHFGDLAYARGAAHIYDFWFHMIQPFVSRTPLMIGIGNHEYLHLVGGENGKDPSGELSPGGFRPPWNNFGNDSGGECGVPISRRFVMPQNGNGVFWYSFNFASTHVIMLSSEHDLSPSSRQYQWLSQDLQNVKRNETPWVIVEIHRPLYNSFDVPDGQNEVAIAMREEFEQLLYDYSADLVFAGHYHSYLRTCSGLYQGKCRNGGATYITVGTAGAQLTNETLYKQDWTEKSLVEWGYGRVTVYNSTALHFEFVADDEEGTVKDDVWIMRGST